MDLSIELIYDMFFIFLVASITFFIIHFKKNPVSLHKIMDYEYLQKLVSNYLPIVAVVGMSVPTILGLFNLSILGLYIALPMFLGPIIFSFVFSKHLNDDLNFDEG